MKKTNFKKITIISLLLGIHLSGHCIIKLDQGSDVGSDRRVTVVKAPDPGSPSDIKAARQAAEAVNPTASAPVSTSAEAASTASGPSIPLVPSSTASSSEVLRPVKIYATMDQAHKDGINPFQKASSPQTALSPESSTTKKIAKFDPFNLNSYIDLFRDKPEKSAILIGILLVVGYFVFKPASKGSAADNV